MKRFSVTAMLCAALAFLAFPAGAADLKATIPFDFHIGDAALPAGEYIIYVQPGGRLVAFRNELGKPAAFVPTTPAERSRNESAGMIVFNKLGDSYFLNGLWAPGERAGINLPVSKHEKEAYARAMGARVAHVSIPIR
jgi:hypothetical protein